MSSTFVRSALAALAICAFGWFGLADPVGAAPRQVVTEYSDTLESSRPARRVEPEPDEPFEPGDAVDWVKDHLPLVIVVGGALLVVVTWKIVSRAPNRKF